MQQAAAIMLGVLALLVLIPLAAALLQRAADAAIAVVPAALILWFIVALLRAMAKGLFH